MASVEVVPEQEAVKRGNVGFIAGSDESLDGGVGDVNDHVRTPTRFQFGEDLEKIKSFHVRQLLFGRFHYSQEKKIFFVNALKRKKTLKIYFE